jgi:hypothetical protein
MRQSKPNSCRERLIYLPAHLRWLALRLKGKSLRIEGGNERILFRSHPVARRQGANRRSANSLPFPSIRVIGQPVRHFPTLRSHDFCREKRLSPLRASAAGGSLLPPSPTRTQVRLSPLLYQVSGQRLPAPWNQNRPNRPIIPVGIIAIHAISTTMGV